MNETFKRELFQCTLDSPGSWLMEALWLKRAAEEIDYYKHGGISANEPERDFQFMLPVFKMLMGLSFENLLKGIIVAQKGSAGSSGKVDRDIAVHKMPELVAQINHATVPIAGEEAAILDDLERYVLWAGRYPFPKRAEDLFLKVHGSAEYDVMVKFWDRLSDHLKAVGWIMKLDGGKLWMDPSQHRHGI